MNIPLILQTLKYFLWTIHIEFVNHIVLSNHKEYTPYKGFLKIFGVILIGVILFMISSSMFHFYWSFLTFVILPIQCWWMNLDFFDDKIILHSNFWRKIITYILCVLGGPINYQNWANYE